MITTVLFDLDGTLLPMDQDRFLKGYLGGLVKKLAPHGYDPDKLIKSMWAGTGAVVKNDGRKSNEEVFWEVFTGFFGKESLKDLPIFEDFYRNDFDQVQFDCGFDPRAAELISNLKKMGLRLILATNPLFPAMATHRRVRWAGLEPENFEWITTYENSRFAKPNPDYYREILNRFALHPEECLMVGNDADEDLVAQSLGMKVFLLTDCLISRNNQDISIYPQGSFPELMAYIKEIA